MTNPAKEKLRFLGANLEPLTGIGLDNHGPCDVFLGCSDELELDGGDNPQSPTSARALHRPCAALAPNAGTLVPAQVPARAPAAPPPKPTRRRPSQPTLTNRPPLTEADHDDDDGREFNL